MSKPTDSAVSPSRFSLSDAPLFLATFIAPFGVPALVVVLAAQLGYLDPSPIWYGASIYLAVMIGQVVAISFGGAMMRGLAVSVGVAIGGTIFFPGEAIACLWNGLTALVAYSLLLPAFGVMELFDELMSRLKGE